MKFAQIIERALGQVATSIHFELTDGKHAEDRMKERNIAEEDIRQTVQQAIPIILKYIFTGDINVWTKYPAKPTIQDRSHVLVKNTSNGINAVVEIRNGEGTSLNLFVITVFDDKEKYFSPKVGTKPILVSEVLQKIKRGK